MAKSNLGGLIPKRLKIQLTNHILPSLPSDDLTLKLTLKLQVSAEFRVRTRRQSTAVQVWMNRDEFSSSESEIEQHVQTTAV